MIEKSIKALRIQSVQAHEWARSENQAPIFADLSGNCKLHSDERGLPFFGLSAEPLDKPASDGLPEGLVDQRF
jgi:hypothetical protein